MAALTLALPSNTNEQVLAFVPALEHAPDQMASRPLLALSKIDAPTAKLAVCEPGTATLMPAGLDATLGPALPVAFTVNAAWVGGGTGPVPGVTISKA